MCYKECGVKMSGKINVAEKCFYNEIKEICEPLKNIFKITFFRYLRVFPDGSRIHLCNNPDWTETFYERELYKWAWFDNNNITSFKNKEVLWDEAELNHDNTIGLEARAYFNIYHGMSMIRQQLSYYEVFDFATDSNNLAANMFYLDNMDLFRRFMFYFKDKADILIKSAEKSPLKFTDLIIQNQENKIIDGKELTNFISQTEIKHYFVNTIHGDNYITPKEIECTKWLMHGKSAEEIATIIGISKRTVEIHFDNIRQKLGCYKTSQIIKIIIDSGVLDIVD